jgi:biotin-(acetyl-CoA carboxylase) ligase
LRISRLEKSYNLYAGQEFTEDIKDLVEETREKIIKEILEKLDANYTEWSQYQVSTLFQLIKNKLNHNSCFTIRATSIYTKKLIDYDNNLDLSLAINKILILIAS